MTTGHIVGTPLSLPFLPSMREAPSMPISNRGTIDEIMRSILPEEFHDDIPAGFNVAGHVGRYPALPASSNRPL